jgi:GNAT superfamily N-acetyltransferase
VLHRGKATDTVVPDSSWESTSWRKSAGALMWHLKKWFGFSVMLIYTRPLLAALAMPQSIGQEFSFAALTERELERYAADPALHLSEEFTREALGRGALCFGALHRGRLVAYVWYGTGGSMPHLPGLGIRYPRDKCVYAFKIYTHSDYRGKRLAYFLTLFADEVMLAKGYEFVLGFNEIHNYAARQAVSRFGRQEYRGFAVTLRKADGSHRGWVSPRARACGFGFVT